MNLGFSETSPSFVNGKHPLTAALLSVVPGLGQLYLGDRRKGILFINVAFANAMLCTLCLWAGQISSWLAMFAPHWHMRVNEQLASSLVQMELGSPASLMLLGLIIAFALYCARDAYDRAFSLRRHALYRQFVIEMSEASSFSYLLHFALILAVAIMALLLIAAPPRVVQTTRIFVLTDPIETVKKRSVTDKVSNHSSQEHGMTKKLEVQPSLPSGSHAARALLSAKPVAAAAAPKSPAAVGPAPPAARAPAPAPVPVPEARPTARAAVGANATLPVAPLPSSFKSVALPVVPLPSSLKTAAIGPVLQPRRLPGMQLLAMRPLPQQFHSGSAGLLPTPLPPVRPSAAFGLPTSLPPNPVGNPAAGSTQLLRPQTGSGSGTQPQPHSIGAADGAFNQSQLAPHTVSSPTRLNDGGSAVVPMRSTGHDRTGTRPGLVALPNLGHDEGARQAERSSHISDGKLPSPIAIPVDFGEYMAILQRRIRHHWSPPKAPQSRIAVVTFSISTGGGLGDLRISRSSGTAVADNAALKAVQDATPFPSLPEGSPPSVDIEFTFTYDVFSGNGARFRRL